MIFDYALLLIILIFLKPLCRLIDRAIQNADDEAAIEDLIRESQRPEERDPSAPDAGVL